MTKTIQNLKQQALIQGVSAYRIANELNVSHSTITRAFNGEIQPSIELVERIARVLGCEVEIIKNNQKTLLIEKTTIGSSPCQVIMLHDQFNERSSYIYIGEVNYLNWVIEQAKCFMKNGYKIINNTEIELNH